MLGVIGGESLILSALTVPVPVDELSVHLHRFSTQPFGRSRRVTTIDYGQVVVRNDEEDVQHNKDCGNDEHGESFQSSVFLIRNRVKYSKAYNPC